MTNDDTLPCLPFATITIDVDSSHPEQERIYRLLRASIAENISEETNMTVEMLRLTLQATKLTNVAGSWKGTSDPYAVVTILTSDGRELKLGKTEVVKNNLSPEWTASFSFDRSTAEETSVIKVSVVDEITKENKSDIPMESTEFKIEEKLPSKAESGGPFPNAVEPSDHYLISADVELVSK